MDQVVTSSLPMDRLLKCRDALLLLGAEGGSGDIVLEICHHLDNIRLIGRDLEQAQGSNTKTDVRRATFRAVKLCKSMKQVFLEGKCEPGVPELSEDDDKVDLLDQNIDLDFKTALNSSALRTLDAQFSMISNTLDLIYASQK